MTTDYEQSSLWKAAFASADDGFDDQRGLIVQAYKHFRGRVALLLDQIKSELPALTLHDITHVDSLWRVASEIAGPEYPLNPAEALVLGGAFLLHDAAHCRAAFKGGIKELRATNEWRDSIAQRNLSDLELPEGTENFQAVLFDTLRSLHPKQARFLPFAKWSDPGDGETLHLFPHDELRECYGEIIGQIAESHWAHPHELEPFARRVVSAPAFLAPATWTVNMLKIAVLLRTADAAHIDAKRAPRFLLMLNRVQSVSRQHWQFQARLNQPYCDLERQELLISGSSFSADEQEAWWLAYDAGNLIDKELLAADHLLRDGNVARFAARGVAGIRMPELFSRHVPTNGWHPVDTSIKITNIKSMVDRFGGEKLYGKDPSSALRELLQNAIDAVHACRRLGGLGDEEGEIELALEDVLDGHWLHVTDTGVGMSRYVLTEVLLDFGRSLWKSPDLRGEWSGLSASGFEAIGQFGIGFFSVFMLSERIRLVTRRFESKDGESGQWLLEFTDGTNKRPILRTPTVSERLKRHGTKISLFLKNEKLLELCPSIRRWDKTSPRLELSQVCARIAPAIDINLYFRKNETERIKIVKANDWLDITSFEFLSRIAPAVYAESDAAGIGDWSHVSQIRSKDGKVVGRCAVTSGIYLGDHAGIGVVKGLFSGFIQAVAGVIFSKPQSDLARKTATPNLSLLDIQIWANEQKEELRKSGRLGTGNSNLLAYFGAGYSNLTIGTLGGRSVTYEELMGFIKENSQLLVHQGELSHSYSDDVLEKDFDSFLERLPNLLELPSSSVPDWIDEADDLSVSTDTWSLDAALHVALQSVWGDFDWEEDSDEVVGLVDGVEITRGCGVATYVAD